ncbi:hypothetical protein E8E12_004687 [Didymella heteroderae]|uniref:Gfd2/YDR514C-like C-terminal domain-containing protein n=1 Tax=Didymella heteroderae TaxID=1769908 RepID=A0A9P4WTI3_9PLEO|nr:hypothetical protein E8E12_004687 [Didymella heteroderae]
MASAARLERLRNIVQQNLDALPDRPVPEPLASDSDTSGGVALEVVDAPSKQPEALGQPQIECAPITQQPNTDRRFILLQDVESSCNPTSMPRTAPTSTPPTAPLPSNRLIRGDRASATQHYSPIVALSKYPYKWCNKTHSQDVASAFFDQGKFWAREWDLYYVWSIDNLSKPLILVSESQVQDLLREINKHLKLDLNITSQHRVDALVSRFPDHPRCTPRFLGRSRSREDYDTMLENVPDPEMEYPPLDDLSLEAFKQLMEESFEAQRAKSKASKAKKQQERLVKQKNLLDQFKRAQRYLGLRPTVLRASGGQTPAVDPALPPPYDFDQDVVFICVDVESYERAHRKITEVGIATLDMRDLAGIAPGIDGEKWRSLIHTRHFRIKEHAHLVNSEFVQGCPDRFYFGKSEIVALADAPTYVAGCFQPPFGAHRSNGVGDIIDVMKRVNLDEKRNLIFLGHDTIGDVRYLQDLGFDPMKIDNLLEALDTAVMYRVWRRELNATGLGRILHNFDIAGHGLHNAGNDAAYTLQAMLAICVREASLRDSPELESIRNSEKAARLAAAVEEAQEKAKNEAEGWSDHEDGDGGPPVPLDAPAKPTPVSTAPGFPSDADRGGIRGRGRGRGGPQALYNPYQSDSNGYGAGRGRPAWGRPGDLPGHKRGGHVENTQQSRGRGRGRSSFSTASDRSTPGSQVRLIDLN